MQFSIRVAIVLFLVAGGLGIFRLSRHIMARSIALMAPIALIFATYTTTNWVVRGALAEFSAMMLLPWGMHLCIQVVREKSRVAGLKFGFLLSVLMLAHTAIAFVFILALSVTVASLHYAEIRSLLRAATGLVLSLIIMSPLTILPIFAFRATVALDRIAPDALTPTSNFLPISAYILDWAYLVGRTTFMMSVAFDLLIICGFLLAVCRMFALRNFVTLRARVARFSADGLNHRMGSTEPPAKRLLIRMAGLSLVLQTSLSAAFWAAFSLLDFVQFPWRLMGIFTISAIPLALASIQEFSSHLRRFGTAFAAVAATVLIGVPHAIFVSQQSSIAVIEIQPKVISDELYFSFSMFGEYYPIDAVYPPPYVSALAAANVERGCVVDRTDGLGPNGHEQNFLVSCQKKTVVLLPLYVSPFHSVNGILVPRDNRMCYDRDFPGFFAALVEPGLESFTIEAPRLRRIARWSWPVWRPASCLVNLTR